MADGSRAQAIARHTGFEGRTAVITGGTKGIGRACVEEFAALGAKVLTCGRDAKGVSEAVRAWKAQGLQVEGLAADVSTAEGRAALVKKAGELFDQSINILVNNVGTNIRRSTAEYTDEEYHFMIANNLDSAFLLTKAFYPLLKASQKASVSLISSIAGGPTTINSGSAYAVTKAGMDQFCRYTACEWAKESIRVNSIKPGYTETPLVKDLLADKHKSLMIHSRIPMRRVGQPTEVAGLAVFLASEAASYLTGQCIAVDGGFSSMGMWPIEDIIPFPVD